MVATSLESRVFAALADSRRRQLVFALFDAEPQDGDDFDPLDLLSDGETPADRAVTHLELKHSHLPKLAEVGFIEWNRESGTLSKGPKWDEIAPLLEVLDDHRDELPDDWLL